MLASVMRYTTLDFETRAVGANARAAPYVLSIVALIASRVAPPIRRR